MRIRYSRPEGEARAKNARGDARRNRTDSRFVTLCSHARYKMQKKRFHGIKDINIVRESIRLRHSVEKKKKKIIYKKKESRSKAILLVFCMRM